MKLSAFLLTAMMEVMPPPGDVPSGASSSNSLGSCPLFAGAGFGGSGGGGGDDPNDGDDRRWKDKLDVRAFVGADEDTDDDALGISYRRKRFHGDLGLNKS